MNTVINVNGFEIEVSEGLNDAFVKVTNVKGDVIADLEFNQEMPAITSFYKESAKEKEDNMDEWQQSYRKIQAKVKHLDLVSYSAYENDDRGIPKDNLEEVAVWGETKIMWDNAWVGDKGEKFQPKVIVNPTWFDLTGVANTAIRTTGDTSHIFFEGIRWDENQCGYQLSMGS